MADIQIGSFRGYSDSSTSHGYYLIYFGYDSISRGVDSVTFNNARVWGQQQGSGYTTNTIYLDQFAINNINMNTSWNGKGSTNSSWSAGWKNMTVTGINAGTTGVTAQFWMHRTGQSWGAQAGSGNVPIPKASIWNDINAFKPDGTTQNGLIFDLSTSDGGRWTNLTNEPADFTKVYGTTATISNIRSNVTGAHYTSNNVTGNGAGSFTWTFTTANWACTLYSAWNTYTITYNGNGATGGSTANSSHTYNTAKALTPNGYTRTGYKFAGWSTSKTATSATYSDKQSVSNLTTANGGTVTLYAVWTLIAPSSVTHTTTRRRDKIDVSVSYSGVAISNITAYYRANSTGNYSSLSLGTSKTGIISGLQPNTNYQIYVKVTNAAGSTNSTAAVNKTGAYLPTNPNIVINNLTPMSVVANVSATAETNAPNTDYKVYYTKKINKDTSDMAIMSLSDGSLWGRIFYHNCKQGSELFTSLAQIKDVNTDTKYSKLNSISKYKLSNGKYEFLLRYPNQSTGYNRWRQTNAPQDEFVTITPDGSGKAAGYEAIHIDWKDNYWGGLTRQSSDTSSYSPCYLSGSVGHGNWFYAIGAATTHQQGIPSYTSTWGSVELWVRLDDTNVTTVDLGTNTSKNITGLTPETSYSMWMSVSNVGGINYSKLVNFTTPADQAKIRIKKNGSWAKGKTYFKKNGQWVKAKKVYIKVNGEWKINNNYDS